MTAIAKIDAHAWERSADEWYVEPIEATLKLLHVLEVREPVWDPACGQGNIVIACEADGLNAFGTDLVDRGAEARIGRSWRGKLDFLNDDDVSAFARRASTIRASTIMCNPPFGRGLLAQAFIRRALALDVDVVMLLEQRFLFGGKRAAGIFYDVPPNEIIPIVPRPSIPAGAFLAAGGKAEGGRQDFVWMVWRRNDRVPPGCPAQFSWRMGRQ